MPKIAMIAAKGPSRTAGSRIARKELQIPDLNGIFDPRAAGSFF